MLSFPFPLATDFGTTLDCGLVDSFNETVSIRDATSLLEQNKQTGVKVLISLVVEINNEYSAGEKKSTRAEVAIKLSQRSIETS